MFAAFWENCEVLRCWEVDPSTSKRRVTDQQTSTSPFLPLDWDQNADWNVPVTYQLIGQLSHLDCTGLEHARPVCTKHSALVRWPNGICLLVNHPSHTESIIYTHNPRKTDSVGWSMLSAMGNHSHLMWSKSRAHRQQQHQQQAWPISIPKCKLCARDNLLGWNYKTMIPGSWEARCLHVPLPAASKLKFQIDQKCFIYQKIKSRKQESLEKNDGNSSGNLTEEEENQAAIHFRMMVRGRGWKKVFFLWKAKKPWWFSMTIALLLVWFHVNYLLVGWVLG